MRARHDDGLRVRSGPRGRRVLRPPALPAPRAVAGGAAGPARRHRPLGELASRPRVRPGGGHDRPGGCGGPARSHRSLGVRAGGAGLASRAGRNVRGRRARRGAGCGAGRRVPPGSRGRPRARLDDHRQRPADRPEPRGAGGERAHPSGRCPDTARPGGGVRGRAARGRGRRSVPRGADDRQPECARAQRGGAAPLPLGVARRRSRRVRPRAVTAAARSGRAVPQGPDPLPAGEVR